MLCIHTKHNLVYNTLVHFSVYNFVSEVNILFYGTYMVGGTEIGVYEFPTLRFGVRLNEIMIYVYDSMFE